MRRRTPWLRLGRRTTRATRVATPSPLRRLEAPLWRAWASSNGATTHDGGRGVRRARGTQAGSEVGRVGANATGGEARARCTRGGGQGELWGSLQGRETVCGGGRRPHPGAAPRRLRGSATPRRRKHLRAKLGCHSVPSFQRAYFEPAADRQVLRGQRTCCPLRGALVRVAAVPMDLWRSGGG